MALLQFDNRNRALGAAGALVYNNVDGAPLIMAMGAATLPAEMISMANGLALQATIQGTKYWKDGELT